MERTRRQACRDNIGAAEQHCPAAPMRNEGTTLKINEAYEHEPLRSPDEESSCHCGCQRQGEQCVDVSVPLVLTPTSGVGPVTTVCRGQPTAVCVTAPDGSSCTVTFTQKVCIFMPLRFGVSVTEGDATIACAADGRPCGCSENG